MQTDSTPLTMKVLAKRYAKPGKPCACCHEMARRPRRRLCRFCINAFRRYHRKIRAKA